VTVSGLAAPVFDPRAPPLLDTHVAVWLVIALPLFAPIANVTVNKPAGCCDSSICVA
jgi:hypothetical protein